MKIFKEMIGFNYPLCLKANLYLPDMYIHYVLIQVSRSLVSNLFVVL